MFREGKITASEFATNVVNAARAHGINCMIFADGVKAYTGDMEGIFYGNVKGHDDTDTVTADRPKDITIGDLFSYINLPSIDINHDGIHMPACWRSVIRSNRAASVIRKYGMQIISHRHQVNIIEFGGPGVAPTPIASFLFSDSMNQQMSYEVSVYGLKENAIAEIDYNISKVYSTNISLDEINWEHSPIGRYGPAVHELLRTLLRGAVMEGMSPSVRPNHKTFYDLYKKLSRFCDPRVLYYFYHDGKRFTFTKGPNTENLYFLSVCEYPSEYGSAEKNVCAFQFFPDNMCDGCFCNITVNPQDVGGWDKSLIKVTADTPITADANGIFRVNDHSNRGWHLAIRSPINGVRLRSFLWDFLTNGE